MPSPLELKPWHVRSPGRPHWTVVGTGCSPTRAECPTGGITSTTLDSQVPSSREWIHKDTAVLIYSIFPWILHTFSEMRGMQDCSAPICCQCPQQARTTVEPDPYKTGKNISLASIRNYSYDASALIRNRNTEPEPAINILLFKLSSYKSVQIF